MPAKSHGLSKHPLYSVWIDMVRRCHKPNAKLYPWYGAKRVTVCDEWRYDVKAFIEWALANGWVPGKEIDKDLKIPGSKIYSPTTCSIVSHRDNMMAVVSRHSGRKSSKLKLSLDDVKDIKNLLANGHTQISVAQIYGVHRTTIQRAIAQ